MDWHFGYNCKYLLPFGVKCRKLIEFYQKRQDLVEEKWISLQQMVIYLNLTAGKLIEIIENKQVKVKRQKDGTIMCKVSGAWRYDDCPLAEAGGQCMFFESHDGQTISYLAEVINIKEEHPNTKLIPTKEELAALEREIVKAVGIIPYGE
jgi:hypothetical protein